MNLKPPSAGVTPPLITPLRAPNQLDVDGFSRLIERCIAGGVAGLFLLGTTGEGPSLSHRLKRDLVLQSYRLAARRVPVLVGLIEASIDDALGLADYAAEWGATALVWTPPFYYPISQELVIAAAERLLPKLPLPVYLYNIPVFTKVPFEPDTLARLAALPGVCGIKDSGGDLAKLARTRALLPETPILWGPEEIQLDAMRAGASGGVNGGANLFPELYVGLDDAIRNGQEERARLLQALVKRISDEIYSAAPGGPGFVYGIKCALEDLGVCGSLPAEPLTPLAGEVRERIRRATASIAEIVRGV